MKQVDTAIKSAPWISFHMECWHEETHVSTDEEGNTHVETRRVTTHTATQYFQPITWVDESAPISSLFYLQVMLMTRLHTNKVVDVAG